MNREKIEEFWIIDEKLKSAQNAQRPWGEIQELLHMWNTAYDALANDERRIVRPDYYTLG